MLVVVEGCIGAGKTTIASNLAAHRKSEVLLESFESNPFLPAFYQDPVAHATETEFTFLLLHFHQLKNHTETVLKRELISDFHLGKDLLYANLNLGDTRTHRIFGELYEVLVEQLPKPMLMICLSASTELLLDRIRQRSRDIELKTEPAYFARINAAYEDFFARYAGPKLKIPMDEWDFVRTPDLYQKLSLLVDEQLISR